MHSSSTAWFHRWTASLVVLFSQYKSFRIFFNDALISDIRYYHVGLPVEFSQLLPAQLTSQCSFQSWKNQVQNSKDRFSILKISTILVKILPCSMSSAVLISNQADIELAEVWYLEGGKGVVSWGVVPNPLAPLSTSSGNLGCEYLVWVKFSCYFIHTLGYANTNASSPKVPTTEVAWDWWHCSPLKDN